MFIEGKRQMLIRHVKIEYVYKLDSKKKVTSCITRKDLGWRNPYTKRTFTNKK